MNEPGYKSLISYSLAQTAFDLGWDFVPQFFSKIEDSRQRDQIKQALRSLKQNIVEGSEKIDLASKLNLYSVSRASLAEALEDFEDILRLGKLMKWQKDDPRLRKFQRLFESRPSNPSRPSCSVREVKEALGGVEGIEGSSPSSPSRPSNPSRSSSPSHPSCLVREEVEAVANYEIDLLIRCGYLLDRQIKALEEKHQTEGDYRENLKNKRNEYLKNQPIIKRAKEDEWLDNYMKDQGYKKLPSGEFVKEK